MRPGFSARCMLHDERRRRGPNGVPRGPTRYATACAYTTGARLLRPQLAAALGCWRMEREIRRVAPRIVDREPSAAYRPGPPTHAVPRWRRLRPRTGPDRIRDLYGRNLFGQGCLLARRLVERGVAFVEVSLGTFGGGNTGAESYAWDTHNDNFNIVRRLSDILDSAWATLMTDFARARPARIDADRMDGRIRPITRYQSSERPRTPQPCVFPRSWPARFSRRPVIGATSRDGMTVAGDAPPACQTSSPPSAARWASIRPGRTCPTWADRFASWTASAQPIQTLF